MGNDNQYLASLYLRRIKNLSEDMHSNFENLTINKAIIFSLESLFLGHKSIFLKMILDMFIETIFIGNSANFICTLPLCKIGTVNIFLIEVNTSTMSAFINEQDHRKKFKLDFSNII